MDIKTVTVVGANGNMGKNVAGILAGFGNCNIFLVSRTVEKSQEAISSICKSIKSDVIEGRLFAKDYSDLETCVHDSDWVFESVAEDFSIKVELTKKIFSYVNKETIVSTGSSGLSISEISMELPEDKRGLYFGTHFFNPPYNLNLCEIVETEFSDPTLIANCSDYLENKLHRSVVRVKDKPAFLANRVGFQFINRAFHLADQYQEAGGIDYIDYLFQGVAGRSMAPLFTADFVGLDVHEAIIDNLKKNTSDYSNEAFDEPQFLRKLLNKGALGKKAKIGLYRSSMIGNQEKLEVYDIALDDYREIRHYEIALIEEMKKQIRLGNYLQAYELLLEDDSQEGQLLKDMIADNAVYSYYVCNELADDKSAVDKAMINGFNWCPPSSWIALFGGAEDFKSIYRQSVKNQVSEKELTTLVENASCVAVDFRRFIKA